jgi:hypothetical protein
MRGLSELPPQRPEFALAELLQVVRVEFDVALAALEPQQGEAQRRLARARFAHQADRVALAQGEAHAVDGFHVTDRAAQEAALDGKVHLDVVEPQNLLRRRIGRRRAALGLGRQQVLGVGMLRMVEHLVDGTLLDDAALGHHADPVGHLANDAEVVGDEQQRHAVARLQRLQELQDLRLDGDVERRRRLVGDQEVGLVGQRHGDHHALALAARELMRIGVEPRRRLGNADLLQ